MIQINSYISYIPATDNPLSSDIVLIQSARAQWLFDVGADINKLNELENDSYNVILSHFHPDHTGNLKNIKINNLYQGENTFRYTHTGTVIKEFTTFSDGISLTLFPLPSTHAKGCLGCMINDEYIFTGDALYSGHKNGKPVYNANLVKEQMTLLEKLPADKVCCSHRTPFIQDKKEVIQRLKDIYAKRNPQSPFIEVDSYV